MQTYKIAYAGDLIATVRIEPNKAAAAIEEMVEFWLNWEDRLAENDGCYTTAWLHQLADYLLTHGESPENVEGWYPLDGSFGIVLERVAWTPDRSLMTIAEIP